MLSNLLLKIALLCSLAFVGQMEKSNPLSSVYCEGDSIPFNPALSGGKFFIDVYNPATNGSASGVWWPHGYAIAGDTWFKAGYEVTLTYQHYDSLYAACAYLIDTSFTFHILSDSCCSQNEVAVCCNEQISHTFLRPVAFDYIPTSPVSVVWSYKSNPWNVSSGPVRINGPLYIHQNINLLIDSMLFEFGPKGKIVVEQKGKLTLNNCILTGDPICETMWHGIRVLGPGYGTISTVNNAGQLVANNNTKIEHAVVGVANTDLFNPDDSLEDIEAGLGDINIAKFSDTNLLTDGYEIDDIDHFDWFDSDTSPANFSSGGMVEIDSSSLTNCYYGVVFNWYSKSNTTDINISNSLFATTASNLRYPFEAYSRGEAGFSTINASNIVVKNSSFSNLNFGVWSGTQYEQTYAQNLISNCDVGLRFYHRYSENTSKLMTQENNFVDDNTLINCRVGIHAHYTALKITDNDINVPISNNAPINNSIGMLMEYCIYDITDVNRIKSCIYGLLLYETRYSIPASNWLLNLRDPGVQDGVNSVVHGNQIRRTQSAILTISENTALQIRCNQFSLYDEAGIYLYADNPGTQVLNNQGVCGPAGPLPGNLFGEIPDANPNLFQQGIYLHDGNVKEFDYYRREADLNNSLEDSYFNNITSNSNGIITNCQIFSDTTYCGIGTITLF